MRVASAWTCPVISSPARCRSRCMPDAASSFRNTSILLSSHVLGTWQVLHPPATGLGYIRTAGGGNPAVLSPLTPLAVPLLLEPEHPDHRQGQRPGGRPSTLGEQPPHVVIQDRPGDRAR